MRVLTFGLMGLLLVAKPLPIYGQSGSPCRETVLITAPWGDGEKEFGRPNTPGKGFPGPLYDVEGGRLVLIDRIKNRLVTYDSTGTWVGADSLPDEVRLDAPRITDLRLYRNKVFWLVQDSTQTQVFTYDPVRRSLAEILLAKFPKTQLSDQAKAFEPYKLSLGPGGLYLLHRMAQQSCLIYDSAPVPAPQQTWHDGIAVGSQWIHWGMPFGPITGQEGTIMVPQDVFFMAAGDGCVLYAPRGGPDYLELYNLAHGPIGYAPKPQSRERGPVFNTGTRYRIENGGFYELYFDQKNVMVSFWKCRTS